MNSRPGDEKLTDCRQAFAAALNTLMAEDERIVVVANDSIGSSNLTETVKLFPDRVVNVGIAEQNMVGVAAGLAGAGRPVFVCAAASFLTARAMEQIKVDIAYGRANVKLCGMAPGMAYGEMGPTHHSNEDLSWLRAVAGLSVVVPADPVETAAAVRWAAGHDGPVFLRVSRMKVPTLFGADYTFTPGLGRVMRPGADVAIVAHGTTLRLALRAADELAAEAIEARVVSLPTVKPLDSALVDACADCRFGVVTVEEAVVTGGLGAAVAHQLTQTRPTPMRWIGVGDSFAPTGSEAWLMDHFGVSVAGIVQACRELAS